VVLLHAGIADRTMWSEHLEPLADAGYRAIAIDLPGFGEAAIEPGEQAPWNDVLQTMRALELDRAVLVGSSFGGAVALRVAVVAPAAVSALALISAPAPGLKPSPELEAAWEAEEAALGDDDLAGAVEAVLFAWVPERLRPQVGVMQRRAFELQAEAGDLVVEAPDPIEDLEPLRSIEVPTLVAAGEYDMPDFVGGAELMAGALPNARHEVIAGTGHLAPMEVPESFRELLLGFVDGVRRNL
jgi:pimeloyl-ACP methyl ester carboxylesterase